MFLISFNAFSAGYFTCNISQGDFSFKLEVDLYEYEDYALFQSEVLKGALLFSYEGQRNHINILVFKGSKDENDSGDGRIFVKGFDFGPNESFELNEDVSYIEKGVEKLAKIRCATN